MKKKRIVITGAAGLIGQNLVVRLKDRDDVELICIDKHKENSEIFRQVHPEVELIEADMAEKGTWQDHFRDADVVVMNHAQIGSLKKQDFVDNNITASENVLEAIKTHNIPYLVHVSSSVVNSKATDDYAWSKTVQEDMVRKSGIDCVVLRPTLMYGWFDRKHLGWLARFMRKSPVFPIPNRGKYIRQPLYAGDFCNIIISCIFNPKVGEVYDISGLEKVYYTDLIKMVRQAAEAKTRIVYIPYYVFWGLLKGYALFDSEPPFTTTQLEALVIPEEFPVVDWPSIFDVKATTIQEALTETFQNQQYSQIVLEF